MTDIYAIWHHLIGVGLLPAPLAYLGVVGQLVVEDGGLAAREGVRFEDSEADRAFRLDRLDRL